MVAAEFAMSTAALSWQCIDRALDLGAPVVMGVLNVTPDSFSDGGRFSQVEAALAQARLMIREGAAIIDVGGESTRPGAAPATLDEELERVIPVIRAIRAESPVFISVDTSKPEVMRGSVEAGADIINDVRALQEPGALAAAADTRAGVCLMHMKGEPATMQREPRYDDVVREVKAFLKDSVRKAMFAGIGRDRIVVDPGFGFGKTAAHNLQILRSLSSFADLEVPLLAGLSRKSTLGKLTGRPVEERLAGSLAMALLALQGGARILRVHDVKETRDVIAVWQAYSNES